jgi:hypothetical protein
MVFRQGQPCCAFERHTGRVLTSKKSKPADLMQMYDDRARHPSHRSRAAEVTPDSTQLDRRE